MRPAHALLIVIFAAVNAHRGPAADARLGEQIFHRGELSSGDPLIGYVSDDVKLRGEHVCCAKCHRPSGFGSDEAGKFTPAITGPRLFQARGADRGEMFRHLYQEPQPATEYAKSRLPRLRPAYDEQTLAVAIRQGIDPTGRHLNPLMPRFALDGTELGHLTAYLRSLAADDPPGVDETTIHFATVIAGDVSPEKRAAVLDVVRAFTQRKNRETQRYLARPNVSPYYKSELLKGYREWVVHTWQLKPPAESYEKQLEEHFRQQPVFALLGGISDGAWEPVHEFCEQQRIPCLFPNTDLPTDDADNGYTVYLSRGLIGEADVLAKYLSQKHEDPAPLVLRQVYRAGSPGEIPARQLRQELPPATAQISDTVLSHSARVTTSMLQPDDARSPDVLLLWLSGEDLRNLRLNSLRGPTGRPIVVASATCLDLPVEQLGVRLPMGTLLVMPYELPHHRVPQVYRLRAWMRSRGIEGTNERLQLNTYFALSAAEHALVHMVGRFSREYFVEWIEHETENSLNPGVFPHLSLGPGQRYASKGAYIAWVTLTHSRHLEPVTDWIVP